MSHMVRQWLERSPAQVLAVDAVPPDDQAERFFAPVADRIELHQADVLIPALRHSLGQREDVGAIVHGATVTSIDRLVHAAGRGRPGLNGARKSIEVNIDGTLNVLQWAAEQPRLSLAWLIAVARNALWPLFFIYAPIYAVQSGLGEFAGGMIVSVGMGFLFAMPMWGGLLRRIGVRALLIYGFLASSALTFLVAAVAEAPLLAVTLLLGAAMAMVSLDAIGNMPFMLAVRPRERAEMTSVHSTYRDAAEILPPGVFSAVLKLFELPAVFVAGGIAMLAAAWMPHRLHPRLGLPKRRPGPVAVASLATGR